MLLSGQNKLSDAFYHRLYGNSQLNFLTKKVAEIDEASGLMRHRKDVQALISRTGPAQVVALPLAVRLSNPREIIVNLWRTEVDAMQSVRCDAVLALQQRASLAGRLAVRHLWKPEITIIYWGLLGTHRADSGRTKAAYCSDDSHHPSDLI